MVDLARIKKWCDSGEIPDAPEFYDVFIDDGKFINNEGILWDFKESWPFSYSDNYWGGIARLICAFSNTLGGVIIFGVHDKKRDGGHNSVSVNVDRLCQAFTQLTGASPQFGIGQYTSQDYGNVVVLLVPPRPELDSPYRFLKPINAYGAEVLWVRDGHEVVKALPQHYPVLFCRSSEIVLNEGPSELAGSLPPSPTVIKRFVGRTEVIDKLFQWISISDEPRTFLFGKGGSGKTAIAYEFAKLLKDHGASRKLHGGFRIDSVIFLSAKERLLNTENSSIEGIAHPDFSSEIDLYKSVLVYGGWATDSYVNQMSMPDLKSAISEFLDISSCVIVVDDIDTLTTKGVEAGFDFIYRSLSRCKSGSKILYTLRNAPSQSLLNSIEVPGLSLGGEYEDFVSACSLQFKIEQPRSDFRDSTLAKESERRPLVVESIIALRRTAGSYKRAVELFEQHAGADVRDYVFSREWDVLSGDNLARYLLLALAELGRPSSFAELETILQADPSRISDAIGAVREMFLEVDAASDETLYSLAQLTKRFILSKRHVVSRYSIIKERVNAFKQYVFIADKDVASLIINVDRLISGRDVDNGRVNQAWSCVDSTNLGPKITEGPIFRSLRGYVASTFRPPKLAEAREDFDYALRMKYEPDFFRLKSWLNAEKIADEFGGRVEKIANIVIDGKRYSRMEKTFMLQQKARNRFFCGRNRQYTEPTDSRKDFSESLKLQLKVLRINIDDGHHWVDSTADHARKAAFSLFDNVARGGSPIEVIDEIRSLVALKDIYLDPMIGPVAEALERLVRSATRPELAHRTRNRLKGLDQALESSELWYDRSIAARVGKIIREQENILKGKCEPA